MAEPDEPKVLTGIARVRVDFLVDILPGHGVCTTGEFREAARKKILKLLVQDQWHPDKFDIGGVRVVLDGPAEPVGETGEDK